MVFVFQFVNVVYYIDKFTPSTEQSDIAHDSYNADRNKEVLEEDVVNSH